MVVGSYLAIKIRYPNCFNYEGYKVLVFHGCTLESIKAREELDPHFLEDQPELIARFAPTNGGWLNAQLFMHALVAASR